MKFGLTYAVKTDTAYFKGIVIFHLEMLYYKLFNNCNKIYSISRLNQQSCPIAGIKYTNNANPSCQAFPLAEKLLSPQ